VLKLKNHPEILYRIQRALLPQLVFVEYGKDREGYCTGDDMVKHTDEVLDCLEFKYPGY